MKLPAETFGLCHLRKKQEQKREETVFLLAEVWGESPIWANVSRPNSARNRQTTHTLYFIKYSVLYFTWKLDRICAKILDKMLHILASNSLGGLPVIRYSNDANKELEYELYGCENAENESSQFGEHIGTMSVFLKITQTRT